MKKAKIVFAGILIGYLLVLISLARIQFFSADRHFADDADYLQKLVLPAKRGAIYDINGEILAGSSALYDIDVDPMFFKPSDEQKQSVLALLDYDEASLSARLKRGGERWARLAVDVEPHKFLALRALGLRGMTWTQKLKRDYPEASLAASLVGFVGRQDDGKQIGYYGLEGYYEDELRGLSGIYTGERDVAARPMFFGFQDRLESQDGRSLYLTIDKTVQQIVKSHAVAGRDRYQAKEVCIIVADPTTMAIQGMSCLPDYDPRDFVHFPSSTYRTAAISDVYEPGSTFKPLIVASAIEAQAIKPTETLTEPSSVTIADYTITNWDGKSRGSLTIPEVLAKSSNIGMVAIGDRLGRDGLYTSILKYGFGTETGIDLQGEVPSSIKPRSYWYPIDYATATFGQGLAVTPIQLVTAFASIVNGGELLKPYVVARVSDGVTDNVQTQRSVVRRVMSDATSRVMRRMLEYTVEHAEYRWNKPAGYSFGGKTGTAQIAVGGSYDASRTIASFIGFTPVDKPRFLALVIIKEPSTSSWGSETAAPLFFDMAKDLIAHYGIPPEY